MVARSAAVQALVLWWQAAASNGLTASLAVQVATFSLNITALAATCSHAVRGAELKPDRESRHTIARRAFMAATFCTRYAGVFGVQLP